MQIQQTITDTAELYQHGPVTLVRYRWADEGRHITHALVPSSQLNRLLGVEYERPVTATLKLPRLSVLTEQAAGNLHRLSAADLFPASWGRENETLVPDEPEQLNDTLADIWQQGGDAAIRHRVIERNTYDHTVWALDAEDEDGPVPIALTVTLWNSIVDIHGALEHLRSHPHVVSVHHDRGRPGNYDPVPSRLDVTVATHDNNLRRLAPPKRNDPNRPGRPASTNADDLSYALTWRVLQDSAAPDPLGLRPWLRELDDSDSDNDW